MEHQQTLCQATMLDIAFQAVRLYAETHPRPLHVTQGQAAEILGISMDSLLKMMSAKKLRLNECGLIPISDLDRVISSRTKHQPLEAQKTSNVANNVKPTRIRSRSHSPDGTLMRVAEVEDMVGVKTTTIYKWMKAGKFPKPLKMGFVSLWVRAEITAWIEGKAQQRFEEK